MLEGPKHMNSEEREVFETVAKELSLTGITVLPEFLSALVLTAEALASMRSVYQQGKRDAGLLQLHFDRHGILKIIAETLQFNPRATARLLALKAV